MGVATGIRAGRAFVELFADDAQLRAGLKRAEVRLKSFATASRQAGLALTAAAGAVALPTAMAVKEFAGFEKQMARVKALTGASGAAFDSLTQQARKLGAVTVFTAQEAADAMSFFALAGFKVDQILKSTGPTLDMAAAGQLGIAESADIAAKIMAGMGVSADDLGGAVDVLTKAMTTANTDLRQLGDAMKYVGPVAKNAGYSLEETVAAIQMLSNAGIQADMAGTTLRGALLSLTDPSAEAADELQALGVEVLDQQGNVRKLAAIIDDMNAGLAGLGSGERLAKIGKIFDARQAAGFAELLSQGGTKLRDFTTALQGSAGTAAKVAGTQLDNLAGDVKILESAFEELQISLGDQLVGSIREAVVGMTAATNVTANWIKAHGDLVRSAAGVTVAIGGIGASLLGISLATTIVGRMTSGLAAMSQAAHWAHNQLALLPYTLNKVGLAFRGLAMAMVLNPAWLAVGAIVAGLAAIGYAAHNAAEKAWEMQDALKLRRESGDEQRRADAQQLRSLQAAARAGGLYGEQLETAKQIVGELNAKYADLGLEINWATRTVEGLDKAFGRLNAAMRMSAIQEVDAEIKELDDNLTKLGERKAHRVLWGRPYFADDEMPEIEAQTKTLTEQREELAKRRRLLRKGISGSETGSTPDITAAAGAPGTAAAAATGPAEAPESGAAQEWSRKLHQLRLEQIDDEQERARALLKERYDFEYAKAQEAGENAATLGDIEQSYLAEYAKLRQDQNRDRLAEELRVDAEIAEARIQAIEDEYEREQASIRNKYDLERRLAKLYGKDAGKFDALEGAELAAAAAAEGRRQQDQAAKASEADADRRYETEELALRLKHRGLELELKLLALEKKRAAEKARAAGEDLSLVEQEYALREQMLRKEREGMGSVGGFDVEAIAGMFAQIGQDLMNTPRPGGPDSPMARTIESIGSDANPTMMQQLLESISQYSRQTAENTRRLNLTFT